MYSFFCIFSFVLIFSTHFISRQIWEYTARCPSYWLCYVTVKGVALKLSFRFFFNPHPSRFIIQDPDGSQPYSWLLVPVSRLASLGTCYLSHTPWPLIEKAKNFFKFLRCTRTLQTASWNALMDILRTWLYALLIIGLRLRFLQIWLAMSRFFNPLSSSNYSNVS